MTENYQHLGKMDILDNDSENVNKSLFEYVAM